MFCFRRTGICKIILKNTGKYWFSRACTLSHASVKDLLSRSVEKEEDVTIKGWVKSLREHKEVTFIHISDGTCREHLQVVLPTNTLPRGTTFGSSVQVSGILQKSHGKGQKCELSVKTMDVIGETDSKEFPIKARSRHTPDYLRQFLHLRPRTNMFAALCRLRSAATNAINNFFTNDGYLHVHTPIITANDCEGAGEVFIVKPSVLEEDENNGNETDESKMFFNVPAYLTVSGQLHLEIMASAFNKAYTFNPTFRAENSRGRHHLSEFWMIEAELAFTESLEDLMSVIERLMKDVTNSLWTDHPDDVHLFLQHVAPEGQEDDLNRLINNPYVRMSYTDAIEVLNNAKEKFQFKPKWGSDLQKEHERYLVKHCANTPVFITDFPKDIKAFYARQNDDGKTVAAVDLLGANVGELCGGSLREDRYSHLKHKLDVLGAAEEYDWYLDLRRFGSTPHGGFGIGFERYLQAILGIYNIRDTLPFPRSRANCKL